MMKKHGLAIMLGIGKGGPMKGEEKGEDESSSSSEKVDLMRELKDALDEDDMESAAAAFEALYQACKEKDSEDEDY